jgi:hypothetical protein
MNSGWPSLNYSEWLKTYETLHRWTQIVGKVRLRNEPWLNHSWASALYVTSRGLGTSAISNGNRNFSIDFDFIHHKLILQSSDGRERQLELKNMSVADFYTWLIATLDEWKINSNFSPKPNELEDGTPFGEDRTHHTYNPQHVRSFFQVLVSVQNVLKKFRSEFEGKTSPVHFFWGSFDLAVTRFSGALAPQHPGGVPHLADRVVREAYSHEVSSCGFWPGNAQFPQAAFYSYAYPEPVGFPHASVEPGDAFYHSELREFLLPYEAVRNSASPENTILSFLSSTFRAASETWSPAALDVSPYFLECRRIWN